MPRSHKIFPLRVGNAIVCENIRQELHGKHSLIGVFSGDILINTFDVMLQVAVYIEFIADELGKVQVELIVSYDHKDRVKINAEFDYKDVRDPAVIASPSISIPIERGASIIVTATCNGKTKRILEKRIRMPSTFATSSISPAPPAEQSPTDDRQ
jgi:hypothetical protein